MVMLRKFLLFNLIFSPLVLSKRRHHKKESSEELGGDLITSLRNDANLDLSMDEEYEDLRAELLAYHTALSSLTGPKINDGSLPKEIAEAVAAEPGNDVGQDTRRSMKTTPCWQLGGICVKHTLCEGHPFLSEIPGCKSRLEICCFKWNKFQMKDFQDKGVSNLALPWSVHYEFGGKGPIAPYEKSKEEKQHLTNDEPAASDNNDGLLPTDNDNSVQSSEVFENAKKWRQATRKSKKQNLGKNIVVIIEPDKK